MLAKELKVYGRPMPREQLIGYYEIQRGRDEVVWTLNMMIEAGLLVEREMLVSRVMGAPFITFHVGLPGQYKQALGLTA
jgi:hypothetical protein